MPPPSHCVPNPPFLTLLLRYSLTKREKADLEYKRKILTVAKEHQKAGDIEKVDRYYVPTDDVVRKQQGRLSAWRLSLSQCTRVSLLHGEG